MRDDGGSIRFRHALVRALIEFVEIWLLLGIPALFCSLANSKGKRFGDLAAGTVVVRERAPVEASARAAMPPELAGWAAVADVGRVPDDLALAARQFLVRAPALDPNVRWSMSQRLATDVFPWLAPPPPQSSAERLLAGGRRRAPTAGRAPDGHAGRGRPCLGVHDAGPPGAAAGRRRVALRPVRAPPAGCSRAARAGRPPADGDGFAAPT